MQENCTTNTFVTLWQTIPIFFWLSMADDTELICKDCLRLPDRVCLIPVLRPLEVLLASQIWSGLQERVCSSNSDTLRVAGIASFSSPQSIQINCGLLKSCRGNGALPRAAGSDQSTCLLQHLGGKDHRHQLRWPCHRRADERQLLGNSARLATRRRRPSCSILTTVLTGGGGSRCRICLKRASRRTPLVCSPRAPPNLPPAASCF
jgi:hypothetical protein